MITSDHRHCDGNMDAFTDKQLHCRLFNADVIAGAVAQGVVVVSLANLHCPKEIILVPS